MHVLVRILRSDSEKEPARLRFGLVQERRGVEGTFAYIRSKICMK